MLRMKSWAPHSLSSEPDIPNQWLTADPTDQECHLISRKQATENRRKLQSALDRARSLEKQLRDALDIYNQRVQKQLDFAHGAGL